MNEVVAASNDVIVVPLFAFDLRSDLFRVANATDDFLLELAVHASESSHIASVGENAAEAFAVADTRVAFTSFEVGLVAADPPFVVVLVVQFEAAVLNSRVTFWVPDDFVLQLQLEVRRITVPNDEGVAVLDRDIFGRRTGDCSVFDRPELRITVPTVERLAVEDLSEAFAVWLCCCIRQLTRRGHVDRNLRRRNKTLAKLVDFLDRHLTFLQPDAIVQRERLIFFDVVFEVRTETPVVSFAIAGRFGIAGMIEIDARVSLSIKNEAQRVPWKVNVIQVLLCLIFFVGPIAELTRLAFAVRAKIVSHRLGLVGNFL